MYKTNISTSRVLYNNTFDAVLAYMGKLQKVFLAEHGLSLEYTIKDVYIGKQVKINSGVKSAPIFDNLIGVVQVGTSTREGQSNQIRMLIMNGHVLVVNMSNVGSDEFYGVSSDMLIGELEKSPSKRKSTALVNSSQHAVASCITNMVIGRRLNIRTIALWASQSCSPTSTKKYVKSLYKFGMGEMVSLNSLIGMPHE